jgi:hypothetical protein
MTYLTRELAEEEVKLFRRYRRAARVVHERFLPYSAQQFRVSLWGSGSGESDDLIPESDFIALLSSCRKIFATKEGMNFGRIANLVHRVGDPEIQRLISEVREGWVAAFQVPISFHLRGEQFDARSILHTWMNGEEFHQDESLERRVELLRSLGPLTQCIMQFSIHRACFSILSLDNLCGLLLGEPLRDVPMPPVQDGAEAG